MIGAMPKKPYNLKLILFWVGLVLLGVWFGISAYLDSKDADREPVYCAREGANRTAYLYLNQLDSSTRKIKARLMVTDFKEGEETLEVEYMTPSPDKKGMSGDPISPFPLEEAEEESDKDRMGDTSDGKGKSEGSNRNSAAGDTSPTIPRESEISRHGWYDVELPYNSKPFFYPFEDYVLDLRINYERKGEKMPLVVEVSNFIDELIISKCASHLSFDKSARTPSLTDFSLVLKRHRFVRAISIILYSVALIFLFYIARREETGKVLTNSLGYIAALWGIRQIIVGYAKLFPTLVDFVTLALYVIVVAIVAHTWLFRALEASEAETPESEGLLQESTQDEQTKAESAKASSPGRVQPEEENK